MFALWKDAQRVLTPKPPQVESRQKQTVTKHAKKKSQTRKAAADERQRLLAVVLSKDEGERSSGEMDVDKDGAEEMDDD
jgi:hypothetical protein